VLKVQRLRGDEHTDVSHAHRQLQPLGLTQRQRRFVQRGGLGG
jgi:hypothetical protein